MTCDYQVETSPIVYTVELNTAPVYSVVFEPPNNYTAETQLLEYPVTLESSVYVAEIFTASAVGADQLTLIAAENLTAGDVVFVDVAGQAARADRLTVQQKFEPIGLVISDVSAGALATVKYAGRNTGRFSVAPGAPDIGSSVFLDTAGTMTITAPAAAGNTLVKMGILLSTVPEIQIQIETIADVK